MRDSSIDEMQNHCHESLIYPCIRCIVELCPSVFIVGVPFIPRATRINDAMVTVGHK